MLSLRKKIFLSYLLLLSLFLAILFPVISTSAKRMVYSWMDGRADELTIILQQALSEEQIVPLLKEQKHLIFVRVAIINDHMQLLYDSHTKRLLGPAFSSTYVVSYKEVLEASQYGIGYAESYSELLGQKLTYLAKRFDFHGKPYIIRLAFPYKYIQELKENFKIGILIFSLVVLFLFSLLTWFIFSHFTSPIRQIIKAITPYQEGKIHNIPEIHLELNPKDEFFQLAQTLNSLSARIQKHINSLTQERNEKEAVLESLVEGVIAVDKEMKISYANSKALLFLDWDRTVVGHTFPHHSHPKCFDLLSVCQKERTILTDVLKVAKPNEKSLHLNLVTAAPRGGRSGAILVIQDNSIHYRALEMRRDFIANASHELKTPITIIRGFAETLQDNPHLPADIFSDILSKIVRNCHRMTSIIKNLLTLADIESLPVSRLSECHLEEMITNCEQTLKAVYPDAQVDILIEKGLNPIIIADAALLELALINLMDNAAKYSKRPAHITIHIHQKQAHWICITVTDQGIGIDPSDLELIFQRFYRVNKEAVKRKNGSGLGLSIVETIIEKHCGKVRVSSTLGVGSSFTLEIPLDLSVRLNNKKTE